MSDDSSGAEALRPAAVVAHEWAIRLEACRWPNHDHSQWCSVMAQAMVEDRRVRIANVEQAASIAKNQEAVDRIDAQRRSEVAALQAVMDRQAELLAEVLGRAGAEPPQR